MATQNNSRNLTSISTVFIVWNLFDIVLHVAIDYVEPLRVAGNIAGLVAALLVVLGLARSYAPYVLGLGAAFVVGFNLYESFLHGFFWPGLIFVVVSLYLLVRWTQLEWAKASPAESNPAGTPIYLREWVAIPVTLVLIGLTTLGGPTSVTAVFGPTEAESCQQLMNIVIAFSVCG